MTMWEFIACVDGYNAAHGGKSQSDVPEMSDEDYEALCELGEKWNSENDGSNSPLG